MPRGIRLHLDKVFSCGNSAKITKDKNMPKQATSKQTITEKSGKCVRSFTEPLESGDYGATLLVENDGAREYVRVYHDCSIPKGATVTFDVVDNGSSEFIVVTEFKKADRPEL